MAASGQATLSQAASSLLDDPPLPFGASGDLPKADRPAPTWGERWLPRLSGYERRLSGATPSSSSASFEGHQLRLNSDSSRSARHSASLIMTLAGAWAPTFKCRICMENLPMAERAVLRGCGREAHSACRACLGTFFRFRIREGQVASLPCPCAGDDGCDAVAAVAELVQWLDDETLEKLERFDQMRQDPKLRECPNCGQLCAPTELHGAEVAGSGMGDEEVGGQAGDRGPARVVPEMVCTGCGCHFCYLHSNAHLPGREACAEYARQQVRLDRLAASAVSGTKCCPGCNFATERIGGCNHMTCRCGTNWCWVCGRELSNLGWHYNPVNPAGCLQFVDVPAGEEGHPDRLMTLLRVFALPCVLIGSALALVFVAAFGVGYALTLPLWPFSCWSPNCGATAGFCLAAVVWGPPFLLLNALWSVLSPVLWALLLPCGARAQHFEFLQSAVFATMVAVVQSLSQPTLHCLGLEEPRDGPLEGGLGSFEGGTDSAGVSAATERSSSCAGMAESST